MKGTLRLTLALTTATLSALAAAQAQFVSLNDNGSGVRIIRNGADAGVVDRMTVGPSEDQLTEQSYWIRFAGENSERRMGTLGAASVTILSADRAIFSWTTSQVQVSVLYSISGASQSAVLSETVEITNISTSSVQFSLFEYDDFDLELSATDDTATILNPSTIGQTSNGYQVQVSASQIPTSMEVGGFPDLILKLVDGDIDNFGSNLTSFTGDATFGMQWDIDLGPNQQFVMGKTKTLAVPEPATCLTLGLAGAWAMGRRRRDR